MIATERCQIEGCQHIGLDWYHELFLCVDCLRVLVELDSENETLQALKQRHFLICPLCGYCGVRGRLWCAHCHWIFDPITYAPGVVGLVNGQWWFDENI